MLLVYLFLLQVVFSAPVKYVTRMHTAAPVTTTQTHTTGTTTVHLPPVEVLISNGDTYTFTLTESPAGIPTTTTSVINDPTTTKDSDPTTTEKSKPSSTQIKVNDPQPQETTSTTGGSQGKTDNGETTTKKDTTSADPTTTSTITSTLSTTLSSSSSSSSSTTTSTSSTSSTSSSTTTSTSSSPSPSSSGSLSAPHGIVYSPYQDNGNCKTSDTVKSDLTLINSKGIKYIRTYGTDCESLKSVLSVSKDLGIKVNQGLWMSNEGVDSLDQPVDDLVSYIKQNGDDVFEFITIANEAIINNYCSVDDLLSKIKSVKSKLKDAGYNGKVTTAEPPVSYNIHPELCNDDSPIDFVSINPHSYFDTDIDASQAGSFILSEKQSVEKSCSSKKVKITETGYPSKGDTNGKNVPSPENQEIAIKSILDETDGDITILTTYNDYWKSPGPYNIEQHFGAINLFN